MKRSARNRTAIISISRAAHDSIGIMRRFHLSEMRTVQRRDSFAIAFCVAHFIVDVGQTARLVSS
jgi:hypothetical protein